MCRKSPSLIYVNKKINTTTKTILYQQLNESTLTETEKAFIRDMIAGASIKELSEKFHKSEPRISSWKREICEKIHAFDCANFKH